MAVRTVARKRPSERIVRDPRILGGEPTIRGTRVPVRAIVLTHRLYPEIARLCQAFPMMTAADVEAALAFYESNRAEIDRHIAENAVDDEG